MVPIIVVSCALVMMLVERLAPGRTLPRVQGWWMRAMLVSGIQAGAVLLAGIVWDPWMQTHRLWSVDSWGFWPCVLVGYVSITFVYYFWHRARHEVPFLWRVFHQLHHSPQRIEIITSFYKHPLEILANSVLSSAILYLIVGVNPEVASVAVLLTGLAELFYHFNIRTPHWVGYLIQRPESHCLHHKKGHHTKNFSDLPVWDMLFGTFENPRENEIPTGFSPANESRLWEMLLTRDVSTGGKERAR